MLRIIWVYLNAIFYALFHLIPIRKRYKNPERYSIEERFKYIQKLCDIVVKRSGSMVIVEGRENLTTEPVVYVVNHPSMIDPYFVGYALRRQTGAVIAGDLWFEKVPIVAPWFKSIGCVFVDRKNPREGIKGINKGIENIKKGHSMLIFAEGEITHIITNDVVGPYQSGGLRLAEKSGVPVIPIVISGTENIYSAHEVIGKLKKGTVKIKFLSPYTRHLDEKITTKEMAEDLENLTREVLLNEKTC
ncbi:MAG: 1-acyl-sn-glycerol-3-phosphate acyltransferase [Bacilli bacterium]|nr:1-acyl-sn-glycerol-3-phosphate acyltransferase [Bacilli bacterium]